jgi:ribA/ribD-fused uncharacterized protein
MSITSFRGRYRFLSNFALATVLLDGVPYPTVEHAFQAAKTSSRRQRQEILAADTPGRAKRLGRKVTLRDDWEEIKLKVMAGLVRQKFQDPILGQFLLETGDAELVEGNTWNDTDWPSRTVSRPCTLTGRRLSC